MKNIKKLDSNIYENISAFPQMLSISVEFLKREVEKFGVFEKNES